VISVAVHPELHPCWCSYNSFIGLEHSALLSIYEGDVRISGEAQVCVFMHVQEVIEKMLFAAVETISTSAHFVIQCPG
jgi:hypothetical protein